MFSDTIFALATPHAKSGVAILRISGKLALPTLIKLTAKTNWQPNLAALSVLRHPSSGETIDCALCLYFAAPRSFTGEDVVELHLHGSLAVIREMQAVLSEIPGLRHAEPGEFTRRAFMNGKMDLLEAEGLADLIEAETLQQKRQSQAQMHGEMSRYYESLRTQMVRALAHLEAYIDFPEEEIPESVIISLKDDIHQMVNSITSALDDGRKGERLREGLTIAIIGAPNAGKSSILNRLAGRDAAIVSPLAGTTRDIIEIHKEIAGFPVTFLDTAGLRDAADSIEEEGVRRARQRAASADLKLIVFDAGQPIDSESRGQIDANSLIVINKIDLNSPRESGGPVVANAINISALTGEGMDALMASITQFIQQKYHTSESILITRARHRELLEAAKAHLRRIQLDAPLELTCEELRRAAVCLGKITGKISVDDVLDVVFSSFCIGK